MGGKDDEPRSDLDKWVEGQRAEMAKLRDELLGQRDDLEKDLRSWTDNASSSLKGPFERFKGFVDSNFSALSEGFKNFPSNISELKAKMQEEREARREEEREIWRRWTGSEESPDHIRMQVDRSSAEEREAAEDATRMLLREAYERNRHVPAQKILDLYRDNEWSFGGLDQFASPMLSFGGACYYKPETVENLPSTARWGWPARKPQWLSIDWFKRSPYSPIRLEAHTEISAGGTKWRAAFEDLLSVALDKPMISEEKVGQRIPHGKPQSTYYGPGLDWMLSLQCRGILPPQLPSLYKPVSLFDGFDEVKRPRTAEFMHDIDQVTSSKSAPMYPLVKRDLNLLIDEIAIKSGPESEAKPLPVAVAPWRVPSTEQELYETMPPFTELLGPWVPAMTGTRFEDLSEAEAALWEALEGKDSETAAKCLDAYYNTHGNVGDLLDEPLDNVRRASSLSAPSPWFPVLIEALRRTSLPEDDFYKQETNGRFARIIEKAEWWSLEEKRKALELMERGDAAAGETLAWPITMPLGELERRVIVLESERRKEDENADQTKKKKQQQQQQNIKENETIPFKQPDVLSQLTTTHTTRLPDGTVTTKVVLKQRFADGREEEHETVHTTHEQTSTSGEVGLEDVKKHQNVKRKGWFWS